jgi:hypothetical protein
MILTSTAFQDKLQDASNRVIRMKIETFDTKMCVPTKGVPFVLYEWNGTGTPNWGSLDRLLPATGSGKAVLPNLAFNWAYSSPFFINTPYYAVEFSGYFYSEESSSDFGFYCFGDNQKVSLTFDGATHITSPSASDDNNVRHTPLRFAKSSSADTVSASTWYEFKLRVWGETGARHNGICLQYTHDFSGVDEADFRASDLKIVNAGVCNTTSDFESATQVTHFSNVQGDRKRNEVTEYTFEVPLGDETGAYIRNSINEYVNGSITLHEGRLIKIWAGYECDTTPNSSQTEGDVVGNVEYISRFTGFIHGFKANRNNNTLRVTCRDFFSRMEEDFCVNYPDASSYWGAGYFLLNQPGEPDGMGAVVAYDRWNVVDAMLDLFLKAGIPASLFYSKEKGRATNGNVVDTVDSVYDADYNLSSAMYYGTDQVEEYLNRYDVGTTLFEAAMKIVDTYGYDIEFKPDGNLRFFPKNNPTGDTIGESIIDAPSTGGGHTRVIESAAQGGAYYNLDTGTDWLQFTNISGSGFALIVKRSTTGGASDNDNIYTGGTASVDVTITINGGSQVWSDSFNFYFEETRYYGQGVSSLIGSNPCYIPLTRSLDYDDYDIRIDGLSTYDIDIDQLWVYNNNVSESVKTLQTYKTTGVIASLSSVDYERSLDDLRNDILVVGQRKGIWVADGNQEVGIDDPEFSAENNNQFVNYHSRAMDVESIYNPSAANYTGRHLMVYVQEPSINTYARADWLSYNMLNTYRDYKNRVNFSLIGDPEVYISDPIFIKDKTEEDGTNTVWVEGFSESINKTVWDIKTDVVGNAPFPSYTEDADYDPGDYNDGYYSDLVVVDNFGYKRDGSQKGTSDGLQNWAATSISVNEDITDWDTSGTMVVYHPDRARYGVFTYDGKSGKNLQNVEWKFVADIGFGNYSPVIEWDWPIENIYNPYEESDYGCFVSIQFRCLVTGTISVGVKTDDFGIYNFIAGLSNGGGLDDRGLPKEQKVYPGEIIPLIWGGIEEGYQTHDIVGEKEIGGGYFTENGQYYFTIDYKRESDNKRININTSSYPDENDIVQNKFINIGKSGVDEHILSYSFENNSRSSYTYSPGGSGGIYTSTGLYNNNVHTNTNYVWVKTDGDINITLKSFYIDVNRAYHVKYSVNAVNASVALGQYGGTGFTPGINSSKPVDYADFQNGSELKWNYTDGYTFAFNPDWNEYGALYFDGHFKNFNDKFAGYGRAAYGKVYWFRLILDIRDGSGRRIHYRNSSGNNVRLEESHPDQQSQIDYAYSERNWDTVLEFMQIPLVIDDGTDGIFNAPFSGSEGLWITPYFEAIPSNAPICWAD